MSDICKDCARLRSYTNTLDGCGIELRYCRYLGHTIDSNKEREKCNGFAMRGKVEPW